MSNQINVYDLHRIALARRQRERECFMSVLEKCYTRIRRINGMYKSHCDFDVPLMVMGRPLFDLDTCIRFMIRNLSGNGYAVQLYPPRRLHISWSLFSPSTPQNRHSYLGDVSEFVAAPPPAPPPLPAAVDAVDAPLLSDARRKSRWSVPSGETTSNNTSRSKTTRKPQQRTVASPAPPSASTCASPEDTMPPTAAASNAKNQHIQPPISPRMIEPPMTKATAVRVNKECEKENDDDYEAAMESWTNKFGNPVATRGAGREVALLRGGENNLSDIDDLLAKQREERKKQDDAIKKTLRRPKSQQVRSFKSISEFQPSGRFSLSVSDD